MIENVRSELSLTDLAFDAFLNCGKKATTLGEAVTELITAM